MRKDRWEIRAGFLLVGILSLAGCTGELFTVIGDVEHKGVLVYPPTVWIEEYETTMLIENGKVIARAVPKGGNPHVSPLHPARSLYALTTRPLTISSTNMGTWKNTN
jgi:hypothetical protein